MIGTYNLVWLIYGPHFEFSLEIDQQRSITAQLDAYRSGTVRAQSRWLLPRAFAGHLFEQCTLDPNCFATRRIPSDAVHSTEFGATFAYKLFRKLASQLALRRLRFKFKISDEVSYFVKWN